MREMIDVCISYDADFSIVDPETGQTTFGYIRGSGKEILDMLEVQEQFGRVTLDRLVELES